MQVIRSIDSVSHRYSVLDGWRGISILCVLAAHLLPIGSHAWHLNSMVGVLGMSIFFVLSGFLIVNLLLKKPTIVDFLIRRFFRILPLAWLYLIIVLPILAVDVNAYIPHFLFYANMPPGEFLVRDGTSHFWSLCVEIQFYVGVAVLYAFFKDRGLLLIPFLCLGFTCYRMMNGVHVSIVTPFRIDEILAGSVLALAYNGRIGKFLPVFLTRISPYILIPLLLVSCHPEGGVMNYFRPYLAALLIGSTLCQNKVTIVSFLDTKALVYIASVSYALYIIHPVLMQTWLGSGDKVVEYMKRPLLFVVLFALAHLSTFFYEKFWISKGKEISRKVAFGMKSYKRGG